MKKLSTIKNKYCRMCTSSTFTNVINIGNHPLVNSLVSKKDIKKKDPTFPIKVVQCKACKLVQLKEIVEDWAELKIEAFQNRRSWVRATPTENVKS